MVISAIVTDCSARHSMLTRRRNIEHSGPGPYAAELPPKNDFDIFSSLPISVRRPHIQSVFFHLDLHQM